MRCKKDLFPASPVLIGSHKACTKSMKDILLFTFPMNFVCICVTWIYYLHIFPLFQSLSVKRTAAIPILCQSADLLKLSTISRYCISFSIKYFIRENNENAIHTLLSGALVCTVHFKEKYIRFPQHFRLLFNIEIYFQGEAVRVARSLSSRMNRSEVDELLSRMEKEIPQDLRKCVHDRPFFLTIAQIPEWKKLF